MPSRPDTDLTNTAPDRYDIGEASTTSGSSDTSGHIPTGNALDQAHAAFTVSITGPSRLTLSGVDLGHGFPARSIDLVELRSILLDAHTGPGARDAAWAELVWRSREGDPAWMIGCIGVAMPGLKAIATRATRNTSAAHADDIVSEMLTAFLAALATVDLDRRSILSRLNWHARRAANRARHHGTRETALSPERLCALADHRRPEGHVDLVLAEAVHRGTISPLEAKIISETRLQGRSCTAVAEQLGLSYEALMKRRRRAESRLATDLTGDGSADVMSRNGA
ncbi:MAG: hypothetical protein ACRDOO_16165 [Actinomadura sp.]